MAAARPSAHNAEFRVFILVLRRLRPVFVVPRARLRVRRESPPAAGLGEWQTACRGCEKLQENRCDMGPLTDPTHIFARVRYAPARATLFTGLSNTDVCARFGVRSGYDAHVRLQ